MKNLIASAAAMALFATSGVAHADLIANSQGSFFGGYNYSEIGGSLGNTETASPTVTNTWLIKGNVTPDCSYYGGSSTSHTLDFGTIGVNTQANTSVNNAFDMVAPAGAVVTSTTAGCNTKNKVTITKTNGAQGLVNASTSGYNTNEFQANLPYTASLGFTAGSENSVAAVNAPTTLTAAQGDATKVGNYGAWRSAMILTVGIPQPSKALLAGQYSDTLTVTIAAN